MEGAPHELQMMTLPLRVVMEWRPSGDAKDIIMSHDGQVRLGTSKMRMLSVLMLCRLLASKTELTAYRLWEFPNSDPLDLHAARASKF